LLSHSVVSCYHCSGKPKAVPIAGVSVYKFILKKRNTSQNRHC